MQLYNEQSQKWKEVDKLSMIKINRQIIIFDMVSVTFIYYLATANYL